MGHWGHSGYMPPQQSSVFLSRTISFLFILNTEEETAIFLKCFWRRFGAVRKGGLSQGIRGQAESLVVLPGDAVHAHLLAHRERLLLWWPHPVCALACGLDHLWNTGFTGCIILK